LVRLRTNLVVDIVMLIVFIPAFISGVILWLVPQGYRGGRYATEAVLMGLSRATWNDIHTITGFALAALIVLHLLLHVPQIRNAGKILRHSPGEPKEA
jgi:cytochrome b subunit of formate dehydrogenase